MSGFHFDFDFDLITSYLLVAALLTLLVVVLIWQRQRAQKPLAAWLSAGLLGILLGSVATYGGFRALGYQWMRVIRVDMSATAPDAAGSPGMSSMGMGGPPGMGGMGMGGMGMGGGGMGGGPRPQRELTTLVRKLDLLTGDIAITLTADQATALGAALEGIEQAEAISDDEAEAKRAAILTLLDEDQQTRLEKVGLPRPAGGSPGGPGGPGGMGSPPAEPPANPFTGEAEAKALASLRSRLAPPADAAEK